MSDGIKFTLKRNDKFINWVNDPDSMGNPRYDNIKVEAVINGHVHDSISCIQVTNINRDTCPITTQTVFEYNPSSLITGTIYITSYALHESQMVTL